MQAPAVAAGTADTDGPRTGRNQQIRRAGRLALVSLGGTGNLAHGGRCTRSDGDWPGRCIYPEQWAQQSLALVHGWATIMLFNVWVLIWPNQKKILGIVAASDEEKASAKFVALMASRTNTFLSIPMLMCMVGQGHGLPF